MPFFKIEVAANEFNEAFSFLKEMGLRAAAVTSPLKEKAFGVCHQLSLEAKGLGAVNSLWISGPIVKGHNTDVLGLVDWLAEFDLNKRLTFVWGGGGTLSSLKRLYPEAFYFSVRSGSEREQKAHPRHCEVLIWAAGAHDQAPPVEWKPGLVLDLNYRDDSVGRQYAYDCQAVYVSGLDFFQRQAQYQHLFWKDSYECK
jgi:shikimate 5-dehydrogenase